MSIKNNPDLPKEKFATRRVKERRTDNAIAKERRTDNAIAKGRRTDNAIAKGRRTGNAIAKEHVCYRNEIAHGSRSEIRMRLIDCQC
jgi:hypothetical protein